MDILQFLQFYTLRCFQGRIVVLKKDVFVGFFTEFISYINKYKELILCSVSCFQFVSISYELHNSKQ